MAGATALHDVDIAIVGGGTAGISAARTAVRAGLNVVVLEASRRIGGRCFTDTITFANPFDHGAHWLHAAERNPLVKYGHDLGFPLYTDAHKTLLLSPEKTLSEAEAQNYEQLVQSTEATLIQAAERGDDVAASTALPRDLGDWRQAVSFRLGAFDVGKPLSDISILDFSRAALGEDLLSRAGLGTLIATLGRGLPIALETVVNAVIVGSEGVRVETSQGGLNARAVIVTVPTDLMAQGKIAFSPALDNEHKAAFEGLKLSDYLHIGFEIDPNAVPLEADTHIFSASKNERTFAALGRASETPVWYLGTGGVYARELEAAGLDAAAEAATDWLVAHFGAAIRDAIKKKTATLWGRHPFIGGAWSVASPGRAGARAVLREPHADRVLFAGEAVHDTLWGTVGGAWESGLRAAKHAIDIARG